MFGLPSGALSAPHSPFAAVLTRSQSGLKFRLASIQLRLALLMRVLTGLFAVAVATDSLARGWPELNRGTGLPLPRTSHAKPARGEMSFQFGVLVSASYCFDATNGPGSVVCAGTYALWL